MRTKPPERFGVGINSSSLAADNSVFAMSPGAAYYFDLFVKPAVLAPVQAHGIWRVRITWPNGKDNFVGKFSSESDALEWIAGHPWLTDPSQAATSKPAGADRPSLIAPPTWRPVSIEFDGSTLNGSYGKVDGMLTVKWADRTNTVKAGRVPPKALARTLLRELAEEEKRKA